MSSGNTQDESHRHENRTVGRTHRRRTPLIVFGLIVVAALGAFVAVVVLLSDRRQEAAEPAGVQSFENLSRTHTSGRKRPPRTRSSRRIALARQTGLEGGL
jgi:hypothetical protein